MVNWFAELIPFCSNCPYTVTPISWHFWCSEERQTETHLHCTTITLVSFNSQCTNGRPNYSLISIFGEANQQNLLSKYWKCSHCREKRLNSEVWSLSAFWRVIGESVRERHGRRRSRQRLSAVVRVSCCLWRLIFTRRRGRRVFSTTRQRELLTRVDERNRTKISIFVENIRGGQGVNEYIQQKMDGY